MIILSVDTSSSNYSIALLKQDILIDEFRAKTANSCSSGLIPAIGKLLSDNSYNIKDVNAFCVGLGPGSFTGLRIGLTTVRALAMALKKPITGVPSIDSLAHNLSGFKGRICAVIDAKQNKIYARIYTSGSNGIRPQGKIFLLTMREFLNTLKKPAIFTGDGLILYKDYIIDILGPLASFAPEATWYPRAAIIGRLGLEKLRRGRRDNIFSIAPLYIYPKECQIRKRKAGVSE
jgi:tRNA threonylcarbamoyladenosine biosynthesis protein TsaB